MNSFQSWLKKPFLMPGTLKRKFITSIIVGLFAFMFLFLLSPFDFEVFEAASAYYAFMYALISFATVFVTQISLPMLFPKYATAKTWNLLKTMQFTFVNLLIIGIILWYYSLFAYKDVSVPIHNIFFFLFNTLLIGSFAIVFLLFIYEQLDISKIPTEDFKIEKQIDILEDEKKCPESILIKGDNKNEELILKLGYFIYASYERNYATFYCKKNDIISKKMIRISLAKIEKQLGNCKTIIRCHKSYLVNTKKVDSIIGNAKKHFLKIKTNDKTADDIIIPVSRSFSKEKLNDLIKNS